MKLFYLLTSGNYCQRLPGAETSHREINLNLFCCNACFVFLVKGRAPISNVDAIQSGDVLADSRSIIDLLAHRPSPQAKA